MLGGDFYFILDLNYFYIEIARKDFYFSGENFEVSIKSFFMKDYFCYKKQHTLIKK